MRYDPVQKETNAWKKSARYSRWKAISDMFPVACLLFADHRKSTRRGYVMFGRRLASFSNLLEIRNPTLQPQWLAVVYRH